MTAERKAEQRMCGNPKCGVECHPTCHIPHSEGYCEDDRRDGVEFCGSGACHPFAPLPTESEPEREKCHKIVCPHRPAWKAAHHCPHCDGSAAAAFCICETASAVEIRDMYTPPASETPHDDGSGGCDLGICTPSETPSPEVGDTSVRGEHLGPCVCGCKCSGVSVRGLCEPCRNNNHAPARVYQPMLGRLSTETTARINRTTRLPSRLAQCSNCGSHDLRVSPVDDGRGGFETYQRIACWDCGQDNGCAYTADGHALVYARPFLAAAKETK